MWRDWGDEVFSDDDAWDDTDSEGGAHYVPPPGMFSDTTSADALNAYMVRRLLS